MNSQEIQNLFHSFRTLLCTIILGAILIGCQQKNNQKLTIATAANMQFAMEALTQSFSEETGIECETIIGSSGKLTAQIKEGAPFDVFVSADMRYPAYLYEGGFTAEKPKIYTYGRLVIWSMAYEIKPSVDLLTKGEISHIALANPKTAPYGRAAVEVLKHYDILAKVESKLVYGESIAQTNQFIFSKAAELGFTAKSVVVSPGMKGQGHWVEVDNSLYSPLAQGIVILKNHHLDQARSFYDFLFSSKGKEILDKFGYSVSN